MKRGFLHFVSLVVISFLALPVAAQSESVVTLSGNGYITAGPEKMRSLTNNIANFVTGIMQRL